MNHVRTDYLKRIQPHIDKPFIKVITGMRRVGKSVLLTQIRDLIIKEKKVTQDALLSINMESAEFESLRTHEDLLQYVGAHFQETKGKKYLFIDEVQEIERWEKAILSLYSQKDVDIYITGSNAHLLASELATLLSGRTVSFHIYPLSLQEYITFKGKKQADAKQTFLTYLEEGALPHIHFYNTKDKEAIKLSLSSIFDTIILKDIVARHNIRDINLLKRIASFVMDNIGCTFSAHSLAKHLKAQRYAISVPTVQNYLQYLADTYFIYKAERFDIQGKELLNIHEKYFVADLGLRHALLGYRKRDMNVFLENLVYLELKRRGYDVYIGRLENKEIDFIAVKGEDISYYQITLQLTNKSTIDREFSNLLAIPDNYPKYVLSLDDIWDDQYKGIKRLHVVDFLIGQEM